MNRTIINLLNVLYTSVILYVRINILPVEIVLQFNFKILYI